MDKDTFWKLIEDAGQLGKRDEDETCGALEAALMKLGPDAIVAFDARLRQLMAEAYSWDLWGAAYIQAGGCSDDGFEYFRLWLITRGRKVFEAALKDADGTLAGMNIPDDEYCEMEGLMYVAVEAFEAVSEDEMPVPESDGPSKPRGNEFDEDDEEAIAKRWPKLWKKYVGE